MQKHLGQISRVGAVLTVFALASPVAAQVSDADTIRSSAGYGPSGFEIRGDEGNFLMRIQARLQTRMTTGRLGDSISGDGAEVGPSMGVNRARLKIGGHGYRPWLTYFLEYELQGNALLDYRLQVTADSRASIRVGQWKARYSRERIVSSGQQQMLDRSLINSTFTVDRQQGVSLFGRLEGDGVADVSYWIEALTGTGRGGNSNDDGQIMWVGRMQWNVFGELLGFSGSDLGNTGTPSLLIAVAAVTNRSPYTAFSSSGGGQLPGFADGEAGQYRVKQYLIETGFRYRGLSWQQEFHWKQVDDTKDDTVTELSGSYAQLGLLGGYLWDAWPDPLEVAVRWSVLDADEGLADDERQEWSLATNWFFPGHRNKLTAEVFRLTDEQPGGQVDSNYRIRVGWDISF